MNKIKKIIRKGKVKILEGDSFTEVIKEKKKDLNDLFEYLSTREYFCFPDIISTSDRTIKYKYYDKLKHDPPEKDIEFISSVALLHYKTDRKSTRLNSSHVAISYAVFCLKKKKKK